MCFAPGTLYLVKFSFKWENKQTNKRVCASIFTAVIIYHHKLTCLNQQIFLTSQFWKSQVCWASDSFSALGLTRPKSSCQLAELLARDPERNLLTSPYGLLVESSSLRFEDSTPCLLAGCQLGALLNSQGPLSCVRMRPPASQSQQQSRTSL